MAQIESSTVKPSWNLSCSVLCSRCRSKQPLPNKHAKGTWISTYVNTCKHHVSWSLFERMRKGILPHFPSKSTQRSSHTGALVRKAKAVDAPRLWTGPSKAGWLKGNIYEGLQAWPFQGSNQHISTLHPSTNGVTHQNTTKTGNWIAWPPIHVIFMVLFPQASVTVREPSLSPQAWNIQPTGQPPELRVSWFDVGVMKLPWNLHGRWVVDPLIPQHLITYVI